MIGLVVNCGSSSVKLKLIEVDDSSTIFEARAEHLGSSTATITILKKNGKYKLPTYEALTHETALKEIIGYLVSNSVISSLEEIRFVGHRVVHGGTFFSEPTIINNEVLEKIALCNSLAPLHNPVSIIGIKCCQKLLPNVCHIAVFDTSFHQTIPALYSTYPIPEKMTSSGVRKYGFHGTSYAYLTRQLSEEVGKTNICAIMAHIGQGVSVCAVKKGLSLYTSMEFSPLSGCMMGTRVGSIDTSVIEYLCKTCNYSVSEILDAFNKESGLYAICGTNNMLEILEGVDKQKEEFLLAFEMFCFSVAKNISNCIVALEQRPTQIVFSGGIGENSYLVRENILKKLSPILGDVYVNYKANKHNKKIISESFSLPRVFVFPTNEELEIAIEASKLI